MGQRSTGVGGRTAVVELVALRRVVPRSGAAVPAVARPLAVSAGVLSTAGTAIGLRQAGRLPHDERSPRDRFHLALPIFDKLLPVGETPATTQKS